MNEFGQKIKVMLVDDHPMVLEGIKSFLSSRENIEVIGEAMDGEEAISKVKILAPDIILMDISMPSLNGIETTRIIRNIDPSIKIIMLTMHDDEEYVVQFVKSGARGYVLKKTSPTELIQAIEAVNRGEVYFSPSISQIVLRRLTGEEEEDDRYEGVELSPKETQVLRMIAEGSTSKKIAEEFRASERTIEKHRESITKKLNLHSVAELTKYALEHGLIKK
jgi:two-component system, NarL family, nitrate/nitrite response regulator NarL